MTDDVITTYLTDQIVTPPCRRSEWLDEHDGRVATAKRSFIKVDRDLELT